MWIGSVATAIAIVSPIAIEHPAAAPLPIPTPCLAPSPGATWSTRTLGSTGSDVASGIAVDQARCAIYLAGDTLGAIGKTS